MLVCPSCAHENPPGARFCNECAAPLEGAAAARHQARKVVTALFCDVTGSTALGEELDPEVLQGVMNRYFEEIRAVIERHGGTVEKFIGDAVMAVFGIPRVHEDDALRAVRAAAEIRETLPAVAEDVGVALRFRTGVNTGPVLMGEGENLAIGDAVNVAARLEEVAEPGEIVIGEETLRLVHDAVEVRELEPLQLKGKSVRVPAYRLLSLRASRDGRPVVRMVGRDTELRRLRDAFAQASHDRSCQLFTILGSAGVGKSRLAAEFLTGLDANVVRGGCLSYGEGITYWPVLEVIKQLGALPRDEAAARPLRSLLGETDAGTSADEIAWAFRKLLEQSAQDGPLVCVLEDLHWGEETFLDLVEHIADLSRDAPLFVLCTARPELLERRSGWGGGKWNATTVLLEPLNAGESDELLEALGGVAGDLRARIHATAEGNPLFLEEILTFVRESVGAGLMVPPTIQALLAARLDQLDGAERAMLERGAVEGQVFHVSALRALSDGEDRLPTLLMALVRKDLVRPERSQVTGDDAYRFRHLLIRDAAYEAVPKAIRADLHQRFANWLELQGAELAEQDELVGHHLQQAARYKSELGQRDSSLAERAGARLATAGRRALWRGDDRAAASLFERALGLIRPFEPDVHLEVDFARSLFRYDIQKAAATVEVAAERAHAAGDTAGAALARVVAAHYHLYFDLHQAVDATEALATQALPLLEQAGDHAGLVHVWSALATGVSNIRGRYDDWAHAAEQAVRHSRLAGQQQHIDLFRLPDALYGGSRPADEALQTLDGLLPELPHPLSLLWRAVLLAMLDRFHEAQPLAAQAGERLRELTGDAGGEYILSLVARLAGDLEGAAAALRKYCEMLQERGHRMPLSSYAPMLARLLCSLGRHEEAVPLVRLSRELGDEQDTLTQMLWRQAQALIHSGRGEHTQAEQLAREAVAISQRSDGLSFQGDALCDLAEALSAAGRTDVAIVALGEAQDRYQRKKSLPMAAQVRARVAELRGEAVPS